MRLHTAAVADGKFWHSLPPHIPSACYGRDGEPCPKVPNMPCEHKHRTSGAAQQCSAARPEAGVVVIETANCEVILDSMGFWTRCTRCPYISDRTPSKYRARRWAEEHDES